VLQQVTAPLRPLQWLLDNPVAVWVGKTSYVVYLVHVPVIRLTRHALPAAGPAVVLLIAGAVTMALTVLLHYAVERPSLRLKDRRLEPVSDAAAPRVRAWRRGRRRPISTSSNAS
jgi:peptidoglycan/LPS O-acetylase OafA/YrhL